MGLNYAVITPVRDEESNLPRLSQSLAAQSLLPAEWVIVDTGSTDGTLDIAHELAAANTWITVSSTERLTENATRGAPIVRAFESGVAALQSAPDVVVKVDADTSMESDYFARLLHVFVENARVGIASGRAYEQNPAGEWTAREIAPGSAWGACRAYRWSCLVAVAPLEPAMGWDGIDQLKAELAGWTTLLISDLAFQHHRREGERDGSASAGWSAQGRGSYYMGYRFSYLLLRALYHARSEPAALAMIVGFLRAMLWRDVSCPNSDAKRLLREQQALRSVIRRRLLTTFPD